MQLLNLPTGVLLFASVVSITALPVQHDIAALEARAIIKPGGMTGLNELVTKKKPNFPGLENWKVAAADLQSWSTLPKRPTNVKAAKARIAQAKANAAQRKPAVKPPQAVPNAGGALPRKPTPAEAQASKARIAEAKTRLDAARLDRLAYASLPRRPSPAVAQAAKARLAQIQRPDGPIAKRDLSNEANTLEARTTTPTALGFAESTRNQKLKASSSASKAKVETPKAKDFAQYIRTGEVRQSPPTTPKAGEFAQWMRNKLKATLADDAAAMSEYMRYRMQKAEAETAKMKAISAKLDKARQARQ
ncbi:hypothetical protein HYALB_00013854 [Hymenoscyphus albidus]|uniref:Uncharacterized protein n=1 Tax=Hymenoscyphus albidus TaxID=595503 RepID=A0A9N9LTS7_9HELO|nr:hypothetical protein HYALB_00013407 [Hymenoscyphus albidus]CAG8981194.1 hypothetical protein HYALB_00013854 [Hymenoscyphus albidus]